MWLGPKTASGYGIIKTPTPDGLFSLAHRYAYYLAFGAYDMKLFVCHRCDNPPCCRPDHLFLGSNADNVADMVRKDRHTRGERNGMAKLTATDVAEIRRRLATEKQADVARELGIDSSTMSLIARGKIYR